jgi:AcrR family transcriptional regulator
MEREPTGRSADTRTSLLEAAWDLVTKRGIGAVTLAEIAASAGVTRQSVYLHFGSRAGLLIEMVRHRDRTSATARRMVAAAHEAHTERGFGNFTRLWFRHVAAILPVARAVETASPNDPDAAAAWEDRMQSLRGILRGIIDRLANAGRLDPGWTKDEATDWLWSRTHIDVWKQLVVERGWSPNEVVRRVSGSAWSELTRQPLTSSP